ncbi:MAG TPA: hypothetical protein VGG25_06335 [Streptosporangiaceae bacterium]|jgi:hypothetical protein
MRLGGGRGGAALTTAGVACACLGLAAMAAPAQAGAVAVGAVAVASSAVPARAGTARPSARQWAGWPAASGRPLGRGTPMATTLSITAPVSASLGSVTSGSAGSVTGTLGQVKVTSSALLSIGTWTATVTATAFSNSVTSIPATSVYYSAGAAAITGILTLAIPGAGYLGGSSPLAAQTATVVAIGTATATWTPAVTVTFPTATPVTAGTYSAVITHSVG